MKQIELQAGGDTGCLALKNDAKKRLKVCQFLKKFAFTYLIFIYKITKNCKKNSSLNPTFVLESLLRVLVKKASIL